MTGYRSIDSILTPLRVCRTVSSSFFPCHRFLLAIFLFLRNSIPPVSPHPSVSLILSLSLPCCLSCSIYLSFPGTVFGSLSPIFVSLTISHATTCLLLFLVSSSTNLYLKNKYMKITFRRNMQDTVTVAWNSVSTFFLLH